MQIWVLEWSCPSDGETNVTLWESENDAYLQAASEIEDRISSSWDMDDETQSEYAEAIKDFFSRHKYKKGVEHFHEYENNYNEDYANYWSVYDREIMKRDSMGSAPNVISTSSVPYKATASGATCRGPCGQFNDYAYADRPDGTHMCRQCSTFNHIFGVTK